MTDKQLTLTQISSKFIDRIDGLSDLYAFRLEGELIELIKEDRAATEKRVRDEIDKKFEHHKVPDEDQEFMLIMTCEEYWEILPKPPEQEIQIPTDKEVENEAGPWVDHKVLKRKLEQEG